MTESAKRDRDTLPPGLERGPDDRPLVDRPKSVQGIVSLRELRNIVGLAPHQVAAIMGRPQSGVEYLESLDLELLEVGDLIDYVRALRMTISFNVEIKPQVPLIILRTS